MTLPASKTQHGYLVLADISGYTSYLAGVELDHAHEILTDLLETIVGRFKSLLTVSKLEGDAVFAYAPEAAIARGETLLEMIESTYVSFCDRRDSSHRRNTCECRACQSMTGLDLKFFVHHGDYVVQQVSGIRELVGSDVNLVHRLMKNHLTEATGWKAYLMFTEPGLTHLRIRPEGLQPLIESYEHLGDISTHSLDLSARRREIMEARREIVRPEDAHYVVTVEYPAPPPVAWEWLTDNRRREQWSSGTVKWSMGKRPGGRMGVGASNHCDHGKTVSVETILDWRPFEYFTARTEDHQMAMVETFYLEPVADGARTIFRDVIRFERTPFPLPNRIGFPLMRLVMKYAMQYEQMLGNIGRLIAADNAGQPAKLARP